jgi:Phosphotransferase enzyme family
MSSTVAEAAVRAAVSVAGGLGITGTAPAVLAAGANVIVWLSPSPVVAKVAASTTAVRADAGAWLQRELDVVGFLTAAGAPVLAPSPEVPAVVHHGAGQVMSFWRYQPPAGDELPGEATVGSMLRELHAVLRRYPGGLPALAPLRDIPAFLSRPQTRLGAADAAALAGAFTRLTGELDAASYAGQPLHGDAGAGNIMATDRGWIWHDFEDTCSGPVAWDLAPVAASQRLDAARVLAAYGDTVDARQLAVCRQLRLLHLTVWYNLYAERLPQCRPRAAELLASWRTGISAARLRSGSDSSEAG